MSSIPPLDLTTQFKQIGEDVSAAVLEVLASGQYINGPRVQLFEQEFAAYIGTEFCVACNSGTDALYLALRALDIGPGDEVITTAFTFFSTAEVISAVGATPVFVDIEPHSYNLDLEQVAKAITSHTRAIMPVHLFGYPVDMTRLMAIAQLHGIDVIEDCAQSTGAIWEGQRVGSIGHIGCFSFFPTKNLGACGDGGAVTTHDEAVAARIRMLREHGSKTRYYHDAIGVNSRLDALQAAILSIKLRYLDGWNVQREAVAHRYHELLTPIPGVIPPLPPEGGTTVWNQYTIRLLPSTPHPPSDGSRRDRVRQRMQEQGVSSMIYYPLPLHFQSVYRHLGYQSGQLPVTEALAHQVLSLPMFPELMADQQERVVDALKDALSQER